MCSHLFCYFFGFFVLLIPDICWNGFFEAFSHTIGFSYGFQKSVHLLTNISWRGWPQFLAQLLQIPQMWQVQGKSYPCHEFCICLKTLLCNTIILNCLLLESAKLKTNCGATSPSAGDSLITLSWNSSSQDDACNCLKNKPFQQMSEINCKYMYMYMYMYIIPFTTKVLFIWSYFIIRVKMLKISFPWHFVIYFEHVYM